MDRPQNRSDPCGTQRFLNLMRPAQVHVDTRLEGQTLKVEELLDLKEGDLLVFDHPLAKPFDCP